MPFVIALLLVFCLLAFTQAQQNPYGEMPADMSGDSDMNEPEDMDAPEEQGDFDEEGPPKGEEDMETPPSFIDAQPPAAKNNVVVVNPAASGAPALPKAVQYAKNKDKLDLALDAVKEDIIKKSKQIESESKWVKDVEEIVRTYGQKMDRVKENINNMRIDVKGLYKKKKQLENLKLQKSLETKLAEAHDDMQTLQSALAHVKSKTDEFTRTRGEVQKTIADIKRHLNRLRGKKEKKEGEDKKEGKEEKKEEKDEEKEEEEDL